MNGEDRKILNEMNLNLTRISTEVDFLKAGHIENKQTMEKLFDKMDKFVSAVDEKLDNKLEKKSFAWMMGVIIPLIAGIIGFIVTKIWR